MKEQLSLIPRQKPEHGGELNKGQRKTLRPLATDRPVHLVMKAERAFSREDARHILSENLRLAEKFGLKIYHQAASLDHVHAILKIPHRREYVKFIRSLSGLLARKFGKGFWKQVPYTRVGHWGRDYRGMVEYIAKNRGETQGIDLMNPEVLEVLLGY